VSYVASSDEKDVPIVIAEDYSIACWARITLRGPIEIELDEVLRRREPRGGTSLREARCRR
jgi:hypothetical protein